jgi:hypothetical protein
MTFYTDVSQQADIAARLAPIRAHFLSTLGPRRERLATFCATPDPLPAPDLIRQLQDDAHKIRGVALTLGFETLGLAAGKLDDLLTPWHKTISALPVDAGMISAMADLTDEIDLALGWRH